MKMTPQEINDYKRKWLPGYTIGLHSDLHIEAIEWCKLHCQQHEWDFIKFHLMYENQYRFEYQSDAVLFEEVFRERQEPKE